VSVDWCLHRPTGVGQSAAPSRSSKSGRCGGRLTLCHQSSLRTLLALRHKDRVPSRRSQRSELVQVAGLAPLTPSGPPTAPLGAPSWKPEPASNPHDRQRGRTPARSLLAAGEVFHRRDPRGTQGPGARGRQAGEKSDRWPIPRARRAPRGCCPSAATVGRVRRSGGDAGCHRDEPSGTGPVQRAGSPSGRERQVRAGRRLVFHRRDPRRTAGAADPVNYT
jgi:hypothetical protein